MPAYLTTAQVAERWACDRTTVTARARSGELAGMRLGTDWRFSEAAVLAYEAAHTTSAETASGSSTTNEDRNEEVRAPVSLNGFTLPADYEPVFPELWGMEPATRVGKKNATVPR